MTKLNIWFSKQNTFIDSLLLTLPSLGVCSQHDADVLVFIEEWDERVVEELTTAGNQVLILSEEQGCVVSYHVCWRGGKNLAWAPPTLEGVTSVFGLYTQIKEAKISLAETKKELK